MSGREMYMAFINAKKSPTYKQKAAQVRLEFAEAAKAAKEADEEKAHEKEDYGNDKDTEKKEKKVHKTETDVKDGEGKKEFEEDEEKKEEKEEKEMAEEEAFSKHFSKCFAEHAKSLEDRLHDLEESMGDALEMMAKKHK